MDQTASELQLAIDGIVVIAGNHILEHTVHRPDQCAVLGECVRADPLTGSADGIGAILQAIAAAVEVIGNPLPFGEGILIIVTGVNVKAGTGIRLHPGAQGLALLALEVEHLAIDVQRAGGSITVGLEIVPVGVDIDPAGRHHVVHVVGPATLCQIEAIILAVGLVDTVFIEGTHDTIDHQLTGNLDTAHIVVGAIHPAFRDDAVDISDPIQFAVKGLMAFLTLHNAIHRQPVVAVCGNGSAPVYNRATPIAVRSSGITVRGAGSSQIRHSSCGMIMPGIYVVVQLCGNADSAAKGAHIAIISAIGKGHAAAFHFTVNGDNGAVAGSKLLFRSNGLTGDMVNAIPGPDPHRNTDQDLFPGQSCIAGLGDGDRGQSGQLIIDIAGFKALSSSHVIQLPGVGRLELQGGGDAVDRSNVGSHDIHIVDGIVFRGVVQIVVSGQSQHRAGADCDGIALLRLITQLILDGKADRMRAVGQGNIPGGVQHTAGNRNIRQSNAVYKDLAGFRIQACGIRHTGREGQAVGGNRQAIFQADCGIRSGIRRILNGGQHSVFHCGAVIQGNIIDIERQRGGLHGLDVGTNDGRRSGVAFIIRIRQCDVIIVGQVDGRINPSGFGNIRFRTAIQVFHGSIHRCEGEMCLLTAVSVIRILDIELRLERQARSAFGDVEPHTQGSGVLAIFHIPQHRGSAEIIQNIVSPSGEACGGVVQSPCQGILTVLHLTAVCGRSQGGISVNLQRVLTGHGIAAHQRIVDTVVDAPLFGFVKAHPAGNIAIFKVEQDLRALTEGHRQYIGDGGISLIHGSHLDAGLALVGGGGEGIALQDSGSGVGQRQGIGAFQANAPAVGAIGTFHHQLHALAIGDDRGIGIKAKGVRIDHMDGLLAHHFSVVQHLDGHITQRSVGSEGAQFDGSHRIVGQRPGHIRGNFGRTAGSVNTGSLNRRAGTGCIVIMFCGQNGMVKFSGSLRRGHHHNAVDGLTLGAVGGDGTHNVGCGTFTLGNEGR